MVGSVYSFPVTSTCVETGVGVFRLFTIFRTPVVAVLTSESRAVAGIYQLALGNDAAEVAWKLLLYRESLGNLDCANIKLLFLRRRGKYTYFSSELL
jgi:hypothetical protein